MRPAMSCSTHLDPFLVHLQHISTHFFKVHSLCISKARTLRHDQYNCICIPPPGGDPIGTAACVDELIVKQHLVEPFTDVLTEWLGGARQEVFHGEGRILLQQIVEGL
jgi:hypothetical protein